MPHQAAHCQPTLWPVRHQAPVRYHRHTYPPHTCHGRYSLNNDYTGGVPKFVGCDAGCCDLNSASGGQDQFGGLTSKEYTAWLADLSLAVVPGIYAGEGNQVSLKVFVNDP